MSEKLLDDAFVNPTIRISPGLHYEDVTSADLAARWAAFLAAEGVTIADDGSVSWIYRAHNPDEPPE